MPKRITTKTITFSFVCLFIIGFLVVDSVYQPSNASLDGDTTTTTTTDDITARLATPSDFKIEQVERSIEISEFGLVTITENFTLRNTGPSSLNGCEVCYPKSHVKKISLSTAYDFNSSTELEISAPYIRKGITYISVFFDQVLPPGEKYQFKLISAYLDCVTLDRELSYYTHVLDLEIPLFPMTPYPIKKISVRVKFFDELDVPHAFINYSPRADVIKDEMLHYDRSELDPYYIESLTVTYATELPPCIFSYAKRTIEIDPWGYIYVTEKQTLKNIGLEQAAISQLDFFVPLDATEVKAHDDLGNLTLSVFLPDDDYKEQIDQLNGTLDLRLRITGNHSYTFTFSYRLNLENHTRVENGRYVLDTWFYTPMNLQINSLDAILIVPEGSHLQEGCSYNSTDCYRDFIRRVYRLKTGERAAAINNEFTIYIDIPLVAMIMRPLFLAMIIGVIASVIISARTLKRILLPKHIPVSPQTRRVIQKFCDIYDNLIASRRMMGRLSRQKKTKELTKKEYKDKRNRLLTKLDTLERSLEKAKQEMCTLGNKFRDIVTSIEKLEDLREKSRDMTATALRSFKQKLIHKPAFDRIIKEQKMSMISADIKIDATLLELREEYL